MPPNMSVTMSTPSGPVTAAIASPISRRASCTSSCQPIDTATHVRQVADDGLGGVHQLGGQLSVRDDDDADHAARPLAPDVAMADPGASRPGTPAVARRSASAM